MRGHIITCPKYNDYRNFISEGYTGIYPNDFDYQQNPHPTRRQLPYKIGTNWDIIADLKRVKPDDYIFLHTERMIYGPFMATSHFMESPDIPLQFKSKNLNIQYWEESYISNPFFPTPFPIRIGIKSIDGVTTTAGFDSMELFKLRSIGLIQSIPERFKYHDMPKIVKPLLNHEVQVILNLLKKNATSDYLELSAQSLDTYNPICLDLSSYGGELFREKILEAWIMENATNNGDNQSEYNNFCSALGTAGSFANSIFTYYTNFLDVLLHDIPAESSSEFCQACGKFTSKNKTNIRILELKKGWVDDAGLIQVKEYADWALKSLANNDISSVTPVLVGTGYSESLLNQSAVKCVKYSLHDTNPKLRLSVESQDPQQSDNNQNSN